MIRKDEKNKALKLRTEGKSYSEIKKVLGISKSTLSGWLHDMPLSKSRILELQKNEKVIEKIRLAKQIKREDRLEAVLKKVSYDIEEINDREFYLAGFFLYWAEGGKTKKYEISLSNTDPRMIRAFLKWLTLLSVPDEKRYIKLHLYADMDVETEIKYWSQEIMIPKKYFKKPYIKKSKLSDLTYISRGHGTCNVIVSGRDISEYVLQGLNKIADSY